MVIFGRVKPEVDPLLSVSLPPGEDIGLNYIGLVGPVAEELEVYLIMLRVLRRQLNTKTTIGCIVSRGQC